MDFECPIQVNAICNFDAGEEETAVVQQLPLGNFYYAPHLPTQLGDLLDDRYFVENLLSDGKMSNVWLCWDLVAMQQVVVKIARDTEEFNAMICIEHDMLRDAQEFDLQDPHRGRIVDILGDFELHMARHSLCCLVLEAMDGTLMDLIAREDERLSIPTIKNITVQLMEGLNYLHKCQIVHTDIKPENILFSYINKNCAIVRLKIGDFGNSCKRFHPINDVIQTPPYRAVEVILGAGYDISTDIWAAACVIFEMVTTKYLFDMDCRDPVASSFEHLRIIIQLLGPVPFGVISRGQFSQMYFDEYCNLRNVGVIYPDCIRNILIGSHNIPIGVAEPLAWFLEFMLQLDPDDRPTAKNCLAHDWLS